MDDVRLFAPDEIFQNSNPSKFEVNRLQWNYLCLLTVVKRSLDDLWSELLNHLNFAVMITYLMGLAENWSTCDFGFSKTEIFSRHIEMILAIELFIYR